MAKILLLYIQKLNTGSKEWHSGTFFIEIRYNYEI